MLFFFRKPARRVLFVCTANVCRSPLAEALLREHLRRRGLTYGIVVASAGTRVAQPGRAPDPRIKDFLRSRGIRLPRIRARALTPAMIAEADRIYVMSEDHRREIEGRARGPIPEVFSLVLLLDGAVVGDEIADPYFSDRETFRRIAEKIETAVERLTAQLEEEFRPR